MVLDSKSSVPQGTVGSNPTLSASKLAAWTAFVQALIFQEVHLKSTL